MTTITLREQLLEGVGVAERRLPLAGAGTAVLEGGDGPPVVLLHGPGGNAAHWASVLGPLAATHRVVAPDLPGQGASAPLDPDSVLAWLGELIEHTCAQPPVLVGNAVGGAIAARFAARHGDRLERLVRLRAFEPAPEFGAALHAAMAEPSERTHDGLWRYCARDLHGLQERMGGRWQPFALQRRPRADPERDHLARGADGTLGFPAIPDDELAAIDVPVTLIWGRDDLATPVEVAEAASARHGWPLHVIEDCADDPPVEQPEAFLDALAGLRPPADPAYERATRLWNGMIATRPAFVATPRSTADVVRAVRAAGQRLGVVTELTFRLHEVGPTVYGGLIAWPFERADEILGAYRALTEQAPRELAVWLNIIRAPAAPFVPPEWHGELDCAMVVCHSGGDEAASAPIRALGEPVFDILHAQPYTEIQSYVDDELLATLRELAATCSVPGSQHAILHVGGALNDHADDDGAVGNRDARYICGLIGAWEPGEPRAAEHQDWLRAAFERVRTFGTGGSYVNFQTADEGEDRIRASYGANYDAVMAVKRAYDPDDVFRATRAS